MKHYFLITKAGDATSKILTSELFQFVSGSTVRTCFSWYNSTPTGPADMGQLEDENHRCLQPLGKEKTTHDIR